MLHVFYLDVVYVYKGFQVFSGVFSSVFISMLQVCVSNISVVFRHMLQVFYMNVAYVTVWLHTYVASICSKWFICFRRML
jgi:hypothetical protein